MSTNKKTKANDPSSRQAAEKSIERSKDKKNRLSRTVIIIGTAIVVLGGIFLFMKTGDRRTASASVKEITYPVKQFQDGKARHFKYKTDNGITIVYFIVKSSDGVIRAAFDACDVCWPSGKGYYQKGDFMVCRNCGRRFASVKVNEVRGGCNPAPLKREVVGDKLVIQIKDMLDGKQYFDFSKGRRK